MQSELNIEKIESFKPNLIIFLPDQKIVFIEFLAKTEQVKQLFCHFPKKTKLRMNQ